MLTTSNFTDVFDKLQDHMFTNEKIKTFMREVPKKKEKKDYKKINDSSVCFFVPKENDTLFWCFYIMKNGEHEYDMIYNRNVVTEKKIKIEYVEKMRTDKPLLKQYKFASLSNIESNLVNDHKININTFLSLCVLEKLNVIYIKRNTYFELKMNDTDVVYIVYNLENHRNGYEVNINNKAETLCESRFKLDNIDKPIKSISAYKVDELVNICKKLQIEVVDKETNKSRNKKELYELIVQYF